MAFDKEALEAAIKAVFDETKTYDGSSGKTGDDAIDFLASELADAIDQFVQEAIAEAMG